MSQALASYTYAEIPKANASALALSSPWLLPLFATLLLQIAFLAGRPSLDGHEVLVAQTAKEMVRSGDYLHPTFAGEPRWQKPPLAYWLAALAYHATGTFAPAAARLPSVFASIGLTLLVVGFARRWFDDAKARTIGLIHAATPWMLLFGTSATVDLTLSFLVALAIFLITSPHAHRPTLILSSWVAIALVSLAKGPVGILFVLVTWVGHTWGRGKAFFPANHRALLAHGVGFMLALLLGGGWFGWVLFEHPQVASLWWEQSGGRFLAHFGPQTRPWYYYAYQVPALTGLACAASFGAFQTTLPRPSRFLVWWFWGSFLFLTLSQGKRDHYILPALLPISLWEGACLYDAIASRPGAFLRWGTGLFLLATVLWSAHEVGAAPWCSDPMKPVAELIERHGSAINQASWIAQVGSNDHSTIEFTGRPMKWFARWEDLPNGRDGSPLVLATVPPLTSRVTLLGEAKGDDGKTWQLYQQAPTSAVDPLRP